MKTFVFSRSSCCLPPKAPGHPAPVPAGVGHFYHSFSKAKLERPSELLWDNDWIDLVNALDRQRLIKRWHRRQVLVREIGRQAVLRRLALSGPRAVNPNADGSKTQSAGGHPGDGSETPSASRLGRKRIKDMSCEERREYWRNAKRQRAAAKLGALAEFMAREERK